MKVSTEQTVPGGWMGWLLGRFSGGVRPRSRLALIERIALAPRQSLALVEAEGRRFLVATSADGAPAFLSLDEPAVRGVRNGAVRRVGARAAGPAGGRASW